MTFNIPHGLNGAGKYGLIPAIDTIAKIGPDLVGIQELTRNHPAYQCEDQPARIAEARTSATGRSWRAHYQQEWFTPNRECENAGRAATARKRKGWGSSRPIRCCSPPFRVSRPRH